MPARDTIHDVVRNALEADGWTITFDPYVIDCEDLTVFADLGADRAVLAERQDERIVVEVKTFQRRSAIYELEHAIGQYLFYQQLLKRTDPGCRLYLAISQAAYSSLLARKPIDSILEDLGIAIIVVELNEGVISAWIR